MVLGIVTMLGYGMGIGAPGAGVLQTSGKAAGLFGGAGGEEGQPDEALEPVDPPPSERPPATTAKVASKPKITISETSLVIVHLLANLPTDVTLP
jgi:hypothetical protein